MSLCLQLPPLSFYLLLPPLLLLQFSVSLFVLVSLFLGFHIAFFSWVLFSPWLLLASFSSLHLLSACNNRPRGGGGGGYSVERWVWGCAAQIGCIFSPTGFSMTPFYFKQGFNIGCSFGCVIYHRFLYRLQKIVILKSNYCQGKFHLFFAIEHAQKLKSLVKVAENPC